MELSFIIAYLFLAIIIGLLIYVAVKNEKAEKEDETEKEESVTIETALHLTNARKSVASINPPDGQILSYVLDDQNGIYNNWSRSAQVLGSMCGIINTASMYVMKNPNGTNAKLYVAIAEDFIFRYRYKLGNSVLTKIPWGNNWYQFLVDSCRMMSMYLLLPETLQNSSLAQYAAETILLIIENSRKSLGYERDGANAVFLGGP
jgi:hypothetical protein